MLRLFASIRKTLLAENKTVRYLKYAIGEVLLIMVGILLALQVQTWNQNRLLAQERRELIENLKADFQTNLISLDETALAIERKSEDLILFLKESASEQPELSVNELRKLLSNGFGSGFRFHPVLGTYRSALSTGSIGLIKDPVLNELFITFEAADRRFQNLAEPARTTRTHGNLFELSKILGSRRALWGNKNFLPERFSLSDEHYRELITQEHVYATIEAREEIASRMGSILREQQETTEQILTALEALN